MKKPGNTSTRIIVSLILIPIVVAITLWGRIPFLLLVSAAAIISFYEYSSMVLKKQVNVNRGIGIVSVALFIFNSYFAFINITILLLLVTAALLLAELFRDRESEINNLGSSLFAVFYTGLFGSTIVLIRELWALPGLRYADGGYLVISIFVTIWVCDSAAFFIGSAIGKHKLFPRVSPNKSWEGAIAGFLFSVITMIAIRTFFLGALTWADAVIIGIIVGAGGQLGDLAESLLKRDAGVKDSSDLIPGHGGVLDRIDSMLLSAPLVYVYLYYVVTH